MKDEEKEKERRRGVKVGRERCVSVVKRRNEAVDKE